MINRRFMIVPPALPSGGHAEPLEQTSKDFLCLLLEMANMRTLIRNYGDVLRCRNLRALARRFLSLARSACRSRRVKVHLNGLAALW
jgi:hypothetical protein